MGGGERAKRSEVLKEERGGVEGRGVGRREAEMCVICLSLVEERSLLHVVWLVPEAVLIQNYFRSVVLGSLSVWVGGEGSHWPHFLITS